MSFGSWEAKDEADDLDAEIALKFKRGYESVEPWPLQRTDTPDEKARAAGLAPKCLLKPDQEAGHSPSTARPCSPA